MSEKGRAAYCRYCDRLTYSVDVHGFCSLACQELHYDLLDGKPTRRKKSNGKTAKRVSGWAGRRYVSQNPVKLILDGAKHRAKVKGMEFNLTEDWFLAHFNVCEATGIELEHGKGSPWSVEIDRIDPAKGYTMSNCRLVCASFNRAKMNWTDENVKEMARNLLGIA